MNKSVSLEEQVRSFLDNELLPEQEQEFLISLAANERLMRVFKTQLMLVRGVALGSRRIDLSSHVENTIFSSAGIAGYSSLPTITTHTGKAIMSYLRIAALGIGLSGFGFLIGYSTNEYRHETSPRAVQQKNNDMSPFVTTDSGNIKENNSVNVTEKLMREQNKKVKPVLSPLPTFVTSTDSSASSIKLNLELRSSKEKDSTIKAIKAR